MPTLAGASGWCDRQPPVSVEAQRTARVSLTMIVKNEQENLPRCLASVEGIFDEIIIVDTGSTDRTKEIAREFGAKVFDFEWIDSFAAARNEALSHATGDYAFWLDADDVVEPAEREKLLALLAGLKRPSSGGVASAMLPVTPPLTRPAGDLSPERRGDRRNRVQEVSAPLTRPAGDLSPAGRGDNQWPAPQAVPALGDGSPDPAHGATAGLLAWERPSSPRRRGHRVRRALRLRAESRRQERGDRRRSCPALSAFGRACAGRIGCMSRSCRRSSERTSRCAGRT